MYLEPWQIFLAGIGTGWLILFIIAVLVILTHVRPHEVEVVKVPVDREEEKDNGGEEV